MTDTTVPATVGTHGAWKGRGMSRDDSDRRPSTPAVVTVANPRRTRLALERVVRTAQPDRAGR